MKTVDERSCCFKINFSFILDKVLLGLCQSPVCRISGFVTEDFSGNQRVRPDRIIYLFRGDEAISKGLRSGPGIIT